MKQRNYSNKDLAERQANFIKAIEGIGDILVFETMQRNKNKNVIQGLKRIKEIIKSFFDIKKNDPEKFDRLILSQAFFDLYKEDEKEAEFRLAFNPEEYLISFSTAINQIIKIHDAAIETKNEEISRFSTYNINWLLAEITQEPGNELFVEQLLKNLAKRTRVAIEKQDISMYASSIHWYIDIVFNELIKEEGKYALSYLDLFDKYFFSSVKYIISENQTKLFESLVSALHEGIHFPTYNRGKIWDYGHLFLESNFAKYNQLEKDHKIEKLIEDLANSQNDIDSKKNIDEWLEKFEELKKILEPHFEKEQQEKSLKIEEEIREFIASQFKYNNLLEIVFATAAFCLFKQKPEYIRYLWDYKQPPDSAASWVGHDLVPETIDGVVSFYFKKGLFERKFDFWEDHHDSELYYKNYFLFLLARSLRAIRKNSNGKYHQIENYNIPKFNIYRLSDLEHSVDEFVSIEKCLKQKKEILKKLGFDINNLDELFDEKLVTFLNSLKFKAQERIKNLQKDQQISKKKVDEFKNNVLEGFNKKKGLIRNIFNKFNLYQDKTGQKYEGNLDRIGIRVVDAKAAFFDEWHVCYSDWGISYGRDIASSENFWIQKKISDNCREISEYEFEKILGSFDNLSNIFIFATSDVFYNRFFLKSKAFKPKWHEDSKNFDVKMLKGLYSFQGIDIPIYPLYHNIINNQILVLNKSKLGTLTQYSPLKEGEEEILKKDIFYMNVIAFSEDKNMMDKFIQEPPDWLKNLENEEKQRDHLRERVLIQIFERYEYIVHESFEGYKLILKGKT